MPNKTETTNQTKTQKRSLRLVCIGDTHGHHRKLKIPAGDILIHSGDFMVDGSSVEEIDDFNSWLGSLSFRHKLVIAGNHDRLFDDKPKLARTHLTNAIYLQDSGVTLEGLKFWGSPVNSVGGDWAFSRERDGQDPQTLGSHSRGHGRSDYARAAIWNPR